VAEELAGPSFYSYNLTTETKINIDELIYINTAMDLPLLTGVGGDGVPIMPRRPVDNTIFYWLEEDVPLPRGTVATGAAFDSSQTDLLVATGHAVRFPVGTGILIDDEVMIVTAIDTATETLTVTRGSASGTNTTAAAHADGSEIIGLGTILIEGAIGVANFQGRDRFSNYCQIFSTKVTASRTAQRIPKYGVSSELLRQMSHAQQALLTGVEQAALYGVAHLVTATNRRQTGGLDSFITQADTSSDWLTVSAINSSLSDLYDAGGEGPYVLLAKPKNFEALDNLTDTGRITTVSIDDTRRGRVSARSVMTNFGDVMLARDRYVKDTDGFLYKRDQFIMRVFQPLVTERLAKTDDTDSWMMVLEAGFQVKGADHAYKFSALDPSAPLPAAGLV
jgi:hypothetical protein